MTGLASVVLAFGLVAIVSFLALYWWQTSQGERVKEPAKRCATSAQDQAAKEEPKRRVKLLFGTQTGTAERFSKQLRTELAQRYGTADTVFEVHDVEDYSHEELLSGEWLIFLLMATYGDGEPTDNAAAFFAWLTKAADEAEKAGGEKLLKATSFGVFGLGNKQYEHFCAVGKRVQRAMLALGATPVVDLGEGDDDDDIEADFDTWREKLLEALDGSPILGGSIPSKVSASVMEVVAADSVASYDVEVAGAGSTGTALPPPWPPGDGSSVRMPFPATVTMRRELHTPLSERSCLHVELDITGAQVNYEAGDHIGLLAENETDVVERAAAALGLSPELMFTLRIPTGNPHSLPAPFPGPLSLREALAWHVDLLSPMTKPQLQALALFAEGEPGSRLRRLLSPEGHEEYRAWQAQSRCLLEVLEEFEAVRPPLGAFFGAIAGRLQTRFYSISSSPKVAAGVVHITCSLVRHPTSTGRDHRGVTSHQLQRCHAGDKLPAFIRRSTFRLPADPRTPVIMIGPGTGLAPFRGFLQERAALAASGATLGPAHLFFGCRNRKHDFIYEEELADLRAQGGYTALHAAFSREGPSKVYVQHHLERAADELWPLLAAGGHVYVCGEAKNMARDVHRALLRLAERSPLGGERFMADLTAAGRYQKDVW